MKSYARYDSGSNIPGYYNFLFIEDYRVKSIPQPVNGVVILDNIVYTDPADTDWYSGYGIIKTLNLGQEQKQTVNGPSYPVKIEGVTPKKMAHNLALFHEKSFKRFIVILTDRNGTSVILGAAKNGLIFSYKDSVGGYTFSYSASYAVPSWFAIGEISLSDDAQPTHIIPSYGKAILKDTAGSILSQNNVYAGTETTITAPNAIITANGDDFIEVKSGSGTDILTVNQFNETMVPSIVGNKLIFTQERETTIYFEFGVDQLESIHTVLDGLSVGMYTDFSDDGDSGDISFKIGSDPDQNLYDVDSIDLTTPGLIIKMIRSNAAAPGFVKIGGTY